MVLLLAPVLATLQAKTKKPYKLPAVFNQARYVYVEAVDGQQFDPRLIPEDRQAIADVWNALEKWNRYALVERRDEADLIFVVRKGRIANASVGIQVSTPPQNTPGRPSSSPVGVGTVGVGTSGEVGSPDDLLEVYLPDPSHAYGALIWQRSQAEGLDRPDVNLLKELKDEVERTYPVQTASQTKKP
jgi:hypothetical protein